MHALARSSWYGLAMMLVRPESALERARDYTDSRYELRAIQAVDKLDFLLRFGAILHERLNPRLVSGLGDNLITRVEVDQIREGMLDDCPGSGFLEYETADLTDSLPIY